MNNKIDRYIGWPRQAIAYLIGMLRILELRQMVTDQLGNQFEIAGFHYVVLPIGESSFYILSINLLLFL